MKWFCRENQSLSGRVRLIVVFFVWWEIFWDTLSRNPPKIGGIPHYSTKVLDISYPLFPLSSLCCCVLLCLCLFVIIFVAWLLALLWSYGKECPYNSSCSVDAEKRPCLLWVLFPILELLCIVCVLITFKEKELDNY